MLPGALALALTPALVGCQPPLSEAQAAEPATQEAAPEYLNTGRTLSEGVRYAGLLSCPASWASGLSVGSSRRPAPSSTR